MVKESGKEVLTIYPKDQQMKIKVIFLISLIIGLFVLIFVIRLLISTDFNLFAFILFVFPIMPLTFSFEALRGLIIKPLIIYNNGITPAVMIENRKNRSMNRFIDYNEINKIHLIEKGASCWRISIELKNKEKIFQLINNKNEYSIITDTFKKFSHGYQ
jgi:hypothetical protein